MSAFIAISQIFSVIPTLDLCCYYRFYHNLICVTPHLIIPHGCSMWDDIRRVHISIHLRDNDLSLIR